MKMAFETRFSSTLILLCLGSLACATGRTLPPGATAPLFDDLGDYQIPITTSSPMAQRYFDQGLILTYGFNHAEAVRSFREAQRLDPGCAMCAWGEAYALGPNINKAMDPADNAQAWRATLEALRRSGTATPRERALVSTLSRRYAANPPEDRAALDRAHAQAMRQVAERFPDDPDVLALYAEALMNTMPWAYYDDEGAPKPETLEAIAALEHALTIAPDHPGAIHFYIHAMELHEPDRAEVAADRLRGQVPGAGHLTHMPSHIYLRVGRYHDASAVNEEAAAADESYIAQCRVQGFYPATYYSHNVDFLQASAAFEGRSALAIASAKKLSEAVPDEQLEEFPEVEEFVAKHLYALARFGRWDEILEVPEPRAELRYFNGAWHYVRGLAFAARGELEQAEVELGLLRERQRELDQSNDAFQSGSRPPALLKIGSLILEGRIAEARGHGSKAVAALEEAVTLQDELPYMEPPPWYFPVREALGATLLRLGRAEDAEAIFREQLRETPGNGWSLFGLAESLRAQGEIEAAADAQVRFEEAWQRADVTLESAVF